MTPEEKAWVDGWKRAGAIMKKLRDTELENLSEEQSAKLALQLVPWEKPPLRVGSGLLELRKLFGRMRQN